MYHEMISMSTAFGELTFHEREPPMPLGEPTALNKERAGQSTEAKAGPEPRGDGLPGSHKPG